MTARASQFFFQLLPTDLCADSNFRHAFLWTGVAEIIMSAASSGLAGALAVSVYTQQPYIRLHTNYHPMWQASLFMAAAVALLVKFAALLIFGAVIIVNDGEIFCACAAEDLDEVEKGTRRSMYRASVLKDYIKERMAGRDKSEEAQRIPQQIAHARGCAFPGSASFCVPERQDSFPQGAKTTSVRLTVSKGLKALSQSLTTSNETRSNTTVSLSKANPGYLRSHKKTLSNPSFLARRCFRRRQVSLNRLRHIVAAFPVIQLLTGAASMTFWFSSSDYNADRFDIQHLTQLPSYKLFNCYICFWALDLVHTPIFLLFATWHYARVDWQMQLLSASLFLNERGSSSGNEAKMARRSEDRGIRRRNSRSALKKLSIADAASVQRCSQCGNSFMGKRSSRERRQTETGNNLCIDLARASQVMADFPLPGLALSPDSHTCTGISAPPHSAHF